MNDRSDGIVNSDQNHVAKAEEKVFNSLNSLERGGSFVENLPNSSELIIQESSGDVINYPNQNGCEVLFSQGDGNGIGEIPFVPVSEEPDLPPTTIVLNTSWGSKIYVVGTSHFSIESQEDVAKVITAVQPNSVVLELCPSRSYMLAWTEEKLEMAQNMDYKIIKQAVNTYGVFQGLIQMLLLSLSFQITREMGMAPGGEFRRAFKESLSIPGCVVYLGDRPIEITLRRAFASMSWWQSLKLAYCVIFSKSEINKDEIEKCKNRDYLGNMLEMFGGEFPGLKEVFVNERDLYLTYSLVNAAMVSSKDDYPKAVVGVVGMGHLAGIQRNWESGKVDINEIQRVSKIPPRTRTSKVLIFTIKTSFYCLALYGLHKLASRTRLVWRTFISRGTGDCQMTTVPWIAALRGQIANLPKTKDENVSAKGGIVILGSRVRCPFAATFRPHRALDPATMGRRINQNSCTLICT